MTPGGVNHLLATRGEVEPPIVETLTDPIAEGGPQEPEDPLAAQPEAQTTSGNASKEKKPKKKNALTRFLQDNKWLILGLGGGLGVVDTVQGVINKGNRYDITDKAVKLSQIKY